MRWHKKYLASLGVQTPNWKWKLREPNDFGKQKKLSFPPDFIYITNNLARVSDTYWVCDVYSTEL